MQSHSTDQNGGAAVVEIPRFIPQERRLTILLFRWLIVLSSLLLVILGPGGIRFASAGCLLVVFFLTSNVALGFVPKRLFSQRRFIASIFALDMILVTIVIRVGGGISTDLYLLYFFVIFIAVPAVSVPISATIAFGASIIYTLVTYWTSGPTSVLQAGFLVKIPFFFLLAIFGGITSRQAAELTSQKRQNRRLSENLRKRLDKATMSKEKLYEDLLMLHSFNEGILNSIDSGVLVMDLDGTVTAFNRGAEKITGLRRDQVLSARADTNETLQPFLGIMGKSHDAPLKRQQIDVKVASGQTRTIGISTYPLIQGKEKVVGVIAVFADLSERKKPQEKMKKSESLALLGEMASYFANRVKRPLSSIQTYSDAIYSSTKEVDERKNYAAMILREAEIIDRTIQEILTFSKDTKPERNEVDTNLLITEVVDSMKAKAEEAKATIVWKPGNDIPHSVGEQDQLKKVFSDLIRNSIAAVGADGRVEVTTNKNEEGVVVEIRNEGPEISTGETEDRTLHHFISSAKDRDAGMRLTMAFKIVEDHGGTMRLESDPGKGVKFIVHLPSTEPKPQKEQVDAPPPEGKKAVVLVADDDPAILGFYKEVLETAGHEVLLARDGTEAIRKVVGSHVDILILDLKMPQLDGNEVMQHIAKVNPGLPIIVSTGYMHLKDDYVASNSNVIAYLSKPVNVLELEKKIQEGLRSIAAKEMVKS